MTRRPRVGVMAWLVPGKHDELIEFMESVPSGMHQRIIIEALSAYANLPLDARRDPLSQVQRDVAWIRQTIERLPANLASSGAGQLTVDPSDPATEAQLQRREERMRRVRW